MNAPECLFGARCNNPNCKFSHTGAQGSTKATTQCRFDRKCTNPACPFLHPNGKLQIVSKDVECRYGKACTNDACVFKHPIPKDPKPTRPVVTPAAKKSVVSAVPKPNVVEAVQVVAVVSSHSPQGLTLMTKSPTCSFDITWDSLQITNKSQFDIGNKTTVLLQKKGDQHILALVHIPSEGRRACMLHNGQIQKPLFHTEMTCIPSMRWTLPSLKAYQDHFLYLMQLESTYNSILSKTPNLQAETTMDLATMTIIIKKSQMPSSSYFISIGDLICIRHEQPPFFIRHSTVASYPKLSEDRTTYSIQIQQFRVPTPLGKVTCTVSLEIIPVPIPQLSMLSVLNKINTINPPYSEFLLSGYCEPKVMTLKIEVPKDGSVKILAKKSKPPAKSKSSTPAITNHTSIETTTPVAPRTLEYCVAHGVGGYLTLKEAAKGWAMVCKESRKAFCRLFCMDIQWLNDYQCSAVTQAARCPFSMIQGPPGTGKTVTGVALAYILSQMNSDDERKRKVLYCGPSNQSVDAVVEKVIILQQKGQLPQDFKVIRVYSPGVEQQDIQTCYPNLVNKLDEKVVEQPAIREDETEEVIETSEASPNGNTSTIRMHQVPAWIHKYALHHTVNPVDVISRNPNLIEAYRPALDAADVILTTCACSQDKRISDNYYKLTQVIVDEAAQATEPEALIPFHRVTYPNVTSKMVGEGWDQIRRVVLIGDHQQLGPVVVTNNEVLGVPMFERLAQSKPPLLLRMQYRMHPNIREFPSQHFYSGNLQDGYQPNKKPVRWVLPAASRMNFPELKVIITREEELLTNTFFCHVVGKEERGACFEDVECSPGTRSIFNRVESNVVVNIAKHLVEIECIAKQDIAVITPYRDQVSIIKSQLNELGLDEVDVGTVYALQGGERDYIICSWVRSTSTKVTEFSDQPLISTAPIEPLQEQESLRRGLGFLVNEKHINVAITRARNGLLMVGDVETLSWSSTFSSLFKHYSDKGWLIEGEKWNIKSTKTT